MEKKSIGVGLKLKNEIKIETWQPTNDSDLKVFTPRLLTGLLTLKLGPETNGKLKRVTLLKKRIGRKLNLNYRRSSNDGTNMD